jgi:predicted aldo/keto reductase-like oxidoreductase
MHLLVDIRNISTCVEIQVLEDVHQRMLRRRQTLCMACQYCADIQLLEDDR